MLILNSRQLIYVHVHKCAGSTIELSLSRELKWNDLILGSTPEGEALQPIYLKLFGLHKHSTASEIRAVVGEEIWARYRTFSTVRSPYERVASLYCFAAALIEDKLDEVGFPVNDSSTIARAWLSEWTDRPSEEWWYPAVLAYLWSRQSENPFSEFLRNPTLIELEPAYQSQCRQISSEDGGRILVKHVLKTEDLTNYWPSFCDRAGLPKTPLLNSNETDARFKRKFSELTADPEDYKFINERFAADFEAFRYRVLHE